MPISTEIKQSYSAYIDKELDKVFDKVVFKSVRDFDDFYKSVIKLIDPKVRVPADNAYTQDIAELSALIEQGFDKYSKASDEKNEVKTSSDKQINENKAEFRRLMIDAIKRKCIKFVPMEDKDKELYITTQKEQRQLIELFNGIIAKCTTEEQRQVIKAAKEGSGESKLFNSIVKNCKQPEFEAMLSDQKAQEKDWRYTILLAIHEGRTDLLECLAKTDYDKFEKYLDYAFSYEDKNEQTRYARPLRYAQEHPNKKVIKKIVQLEKDHYPLSAAIGDKPEPEAFKKWLLDGPKQFRPDDWNRAVVTAIDSEQVELLKILATVDRAKFIRSLQVSSEFRTSDGYRIDEYPLERAVYANKPRVIEVLDVLVAQMPDIVNFKSKNDSRNAGALHIAAEHGHEKIIRFLLKNNAASYRINGEFPLSLAFKHNQEKAYISASGSEFHEEELLNLLCSNCHGERANSLPQGITIIKNKKNAEIKSEDVELLLSPTAGTKFLDNFPKNEIWRLFVDGKKQRPAEAKMASAEHAEQKNPIDSEKGWCGYEDREPGCIDLMYQAFAMACLNKNLTKDFGIQIHKKAGDHFKRKIEDRFFSSWENSLILSGDSQTLSLDGYLELTKAPYTEWISWGWSPENDMLKVHPRLYDEKTLEAQFDKYNEAQKSTPASDRKKILENIILLASSYARIHPRSDGNNRTATIILNSELIKHGFSPAILENPNRLEGFSQAELLNEVYRGMLNVRHVIDFGCYPNGKSTVELQKSIPLEDLRNIPDAIAKQWEKTLKEIDRQQSNLESSKPLEGTQVPSSTAAILGVINSQNRPVEATIKVEESKQKDTPAQPTAQPPPSPAPQSSPPSADSQPPTQTFRR